MTKTKRILIPVLIAVAVVAIVLTLILTISSCNKDKDNSGSGGVQVSIFEGGVTDVNLTEDYKLTDLDVTATGGADKVVALTKAVNFNLSTHVLDLNGYTLKITSDVTDCIVAFSQGIIKNGTLDVSVPNGDIDFSGVTIEASVTYTLEAASSTVYFSDVNNAGAGVIKSDTRVEVARSNFNELTFEGNVDFKANYSSLFQKVIVGSAATDAVIDVLNGSKIAELILSGKTVVNIQGEVEKLTAEKESRVNVAARALIKEINAKAKLFLDVSGNVFDVNISDNATSEVNVSATGSVQNIDAQGVSTVTVEGSVGTILLGDNAGASSVSVAEGRASVKKVVVNASNANVVGNANSFNEIIVAEGKKETTTLPEGIDATVVGEDEINSYLEKHTYIEESRKDATCSAEGYVVYVCEACGEDDVVRVTIPAKGHSFKTEVISLPSKLEAGEKKHTCEVCGYSYVEKISATGIESKTISGLLGALLGDGTYSITVDENSTITRTDDEDVYGLTYKVTEGVLDVTDGVPTGHIKIEIEFNDSVVGLVEDAAIYFYLNGNDVYFEICPVPDEHDGNTSTISSITELFEVAIYNIFYYNYNVSFGEEELFLIIDYYNALTAVLSTYEPLVDGVFGSVVEVVAGLDVFGTLLDAFCTVTESEGDTVYSFSANGLRGVADVLAEYTVEELVDELAGKGVYGNLIKTVKNLPYYTIEEIANTAISFAENYGADVDATFALIERVVYDATGAEINIKEFINSGSIDNTIASIVYAELGYDDEEEFFEYYTEAIANFAEAFETLTLDQIYNLFVYGEPDYVIPPDLLEPEGTEPLDGEDGELEEDEELEVEGEPYLLSDEIYALADLIEDSAELSLIFSGDGVLKCLSVELLEGMVIVDYYVEDDTYSVSADYMEYSVEALLSVEEETISGNVALYVEDGEEPLYNGTLLVNIDGTGVMVNVSLYTSGSEEPMYSAKVGYGTKNGETVVTAVLYAEGSEEPVYSASVIVDETEETFEAIFTQVDAVIAEIIASVDRTDGNTIVDFDANTMGYYVTVDADKDEGTAEVIFGYMDEETLKATLTTSDEGVIDLDLYFADEWIYSTNLDYIDKGNFSTIITLPSEGDNINYVLTVTTIDNTYAIVITKEVNGVVIENYAFNVTAYDENNVCSVLLGLNVDFMEYGALFNVLSCEVTYEATRGDDGSLERIYVGFDGKIVNNVDVATTSTKTEYTELNLGVTVDVESELEVDDSVKDVIVDEEFTLAGIDVVHYKDWDLVYGDEPYYEYVEYTRYVEDEDGDYIELIEESFSVVFDENNEGYAELTISKYVSKIPAANGLPTGGTLSYEKKCGSVYYVELTDLTECDETASVEYGLYSIDENGIISVESDEGESIVYEEYGRTRLCGRKFYYDVESKSISDDYQHNYVSTYEGVDGCCENAEYYLEILTCSDCGHKTVEPKNLHVYKQENFLVPNGEVTIVKCHCGMAYGYDYGLDVLRNSDDNVTEEIAELGYSIADVVEGSDKKDTYICSNTGLTGIHYTWVTKAEGEFCETHNYVSIVYEGYDDGNGNVYAPYENSWYYSVTHINSSLLETTDTLSEEEIAEFNALLNGVATVDSGVVSRYCCKYCEYVSFERYRYFFESEHLIQLEVNYDKKGNVVDYYLKTESDLIAESIIDETWMEFPSNEWESSMTKSYANENGEIYLNRIEIQYGEDLSGSEIYVIYYQLNNYVEIFYYDYVNCLEKSYEIYLDDDGEILAVIVDEREFHDVIKDKIPLGDYCNKGFHQAYLCKSCGEVVEVDDSRVIYFPHVESDYQEGTGAAVLVEAGAIIGDTSGLSCNYEYNFCEECGLLVNLSISLTADWTLTDDVTIIAESFYMNLNGYTIDLNGYNLIVYSVCDVVDWASTVMIENTSDSAGGIVDGSASADGYLVVFTEYGYISINVAYDKIYANGSCSIEDIEDEFYYETGKELGIF